MAAELITFANKVDSIVTATPRINKTEAADWNETKSAINVNAALTDANTTAAGTNAASVTELESVTGWASYSDSQYTVSSPLSIAAGATTALPNNAAVSIVTQLPIGVSSLYNPATSKIIGANVNDAYTVRVSFKCKTSSVSGQAFLQLNIGGIAPIILDINIAFPKGANTETPFTETGLVFSANTYVANGAGFQVVSVTGTTLIYDIRYVIARIHKGR
jgi:hypothetical protein